MTRRRARKSGGHPRARPGARPRGGARGALSDDTMAKLRGLGIAAAVAIATFFAFLPTLENGFVDWDDQYNFLLNESYRGLGWTKLKWMFTAFHLGHYAPLTWITFGADYLVWGLDPFGYHLTNLLLHTANAVVFYLIAVRLLSASVPDAASRPLLLRFVAAFAALVFAIHPLRVESVAWATERKDVLSALFYLLAVLVYLKPKQVPSGRPAVQRRGYWLCFLLFVLALLSKSMAVTMPAVLLLLDIYPLRRFSLTVAGLRSSQARWALLEKVPFFALSALASIGAFRGTIAESVLTTEEALRWVDRAAVAVYGLGFYLSKLVFPSRLANLYALPIPFDPLAPPVLLSAVSVAGLVLLSTWLARRTLVFLIAFAIYTVILLPVIGIFHNGPQIAADRYTYLALLPWTILLGAARSSRRLGRACPCFTRQAARRRAHCCPIASRAHPRRPHMASGPGLARLRDPLGKRGQVRALRAGTPGLGPRARAARQDSRSPASPASQRRSASGRPLGTLRARGRPRASGTASRGDRALRARGTPEPHQPALPKLPRPRPPEGGQGRRGGHRASSGGRSERGLGRGA